MNELINEYVSDNNLQFTELEKFEISIWELINFLIEVYILICSEKLRNYEMIKKLLWNEKFRNEKKLKKPSAK